MIDAHSYFWFVVAPTWTWDQLVVLSYLGPETLMPLASALAAIVGVVLMFGRVIVRFFKKILGPIRSKSDEEPGNQPLSAGPDSGIRDKAHGS